ncbi:MAG: hypothetical protein HQK54_03040 [Oligoflexales bacterium]|nr:hypothetical protein [Oligoflexales bacterium]
MIKSKIGKSVLALKCILPLLLLLGCVQASRQGSNLNSSSSSTEEKLRELEKNDPVGFKQITKEGARTCYDAGGDVIKINYCGEGKGIMATNPNIKFAIPSDDSPPRVCCMPVNSCTDGEHKTEDFECCDEKEAAWFRPACVLTKKGSSNDKYTKIIDCDNSKWHECHKSTAQKNK